jgi:hypothetical protein
MRPLLRSELKHPFETMDFLSQRPILRQTETHWFFEINILSCPDGGQGGQDMPVVWRGDQKCIDVLARHDLTKITVGSAILVTVPLVNLLAGKSELVLLNIAHRDHLHIFLWKKPV